MNRRGFICAMAVAAAAIATNARAEASLAPLGDLRRVAAQIERLRAPLIVLFSVPGCPFCHEVRQHYLMPRLPDAARGAFVLAELDITSGRELVGLDGTVTTERAFAAKMGFRMAPVVAAFDSRMQLLGEPLIGLDPSGFYESYLANLIDNAQRRLSR